MCRPGISWSWKLPGMIDSMWTLCPSWVVDREVQCDGCYSTNGDRYVTMLRNFWSCVGVSRQGMLCTTLILAELGCALSFSCTHPKKVSDGYLTAHYPSLNTSHFHQLVEVYVMFFITLAMDDNIICNANLPITVLIYLVHCALEDV